MGCGLNSALSQVGTKGAERCGEVRVSERPHPPIPPVGGRGADKHGGSLFEGAEITGLILGVDIGRAGALALLTPAGELIDVADMPILEDGPKSRPTVCAPLLAGIVQRWMPACAYVEFVGARPDDSRVGAFAFGRSRGAIEGVLGCAGVTTQFLTPATWKRAVGIPPGREGAKDLARAEAIRRWPARAALFARKSDDGRAEAALIAVAGMIRFGAGAGALRPAPEAALVVESAP